MDLSTKDRNSRHISVIVSPKVDHPGLQAATSNDDLMKALASNPWATALMMQYAAMPSMLDKPPHTSLPDQRHPLLPPVQPSQARNQSFGALLKAAVRNRNAISNSSDAPPTTPATPTAATAADTVQPPPAPPAAVPNRMSYPREFKLFVIGYYYSNGQNKYRTCKEFQITKSMLNGWLQKMEKIQQSRPGSLKAGRSGRKPQFPQVERELYNVYLTHLAKGRKVGNRWLRDTAKCIAQRRCSTDELNGMCQFSERWLCNFKKRFGINLTKDWNEKPSNGAETLTNTDTTTECASPPSSDNQMDIKLDASDSSITNEIAQPSPDTTVDSEKMISPKIEIQKEHQINPNIVVGAPHPILEIHPPPVHQYEPGKRGRKVQFPQVERALFKKVRDKQKEGTRISNRWLQDEARRLAIELCPQLFTDTFKSARCMFSEHWLHNFKKRYGITLKQSAGRSDELTGIYGPNETTLEPVTSSDDIHQNFNCDEDPVGDGIGKMIPNERKPSINGNASNIDYLPTMVPLPIVCNSVIPPTINFAEWYSKSATTIVDTRNDIDDHTKTE